jgi:hypothetical protein
MRFCDLVPLVVSFRKTSISVEQLRAPFGRLGNKTVMTPYRDLRS